MAIIISVPVSHMYKFPSHSSEHIDEVLYGEEVEIIDTIEDFVKIKNDSGYLGWIQKSDTAQQHSKPNMMINLPFADLLPDAKNYYSPILTLPLGALVDVGFSHEKEFERYGFVLLPDKRIFYIRKSALANIPKKSENNDEMREKIVSNAKKILKRSISMGRKNSVWHRLFRTCVHGIPTFGRKNLARCRF
ncbi:MAG: SH3 domain-containing protein [Clostridia bacterium]